MKVELRGKGLIYNSIQHIYPFTSPGDLIVCSGDSHIYKDREIQGKTIINIHTSMLPRYRGRHPVDWAMENMEPEIGITIHYIQDGTIDTGDIILQDSVPYHGEGYDTVMDNICKKVPAMLLAAIKQIEQGCVYRRKQNNELATYYPKRTKPRVY